MLRIGLLLVFMLIAACGGDESAGGTSNDLKRWLQGEKDIGREEANCVLEEMMRADLTEDEIAEFTSLDPDGSEGDYEEPARINVYTDARLACDELSAETTTTEAEDEGAGVEVYTDDVCGSIDRWYDEIERASNSLTEDAGEIASDPAAGKALVVDFLDDVIGYTDDLIEDLEGAGVPDVQEGQETADELVAGIEDVRELFDGARADTKALPVDDPQALGTGLQDTGAALQESATAVGAIFENVLWSVDDSELGAAFEDAASCRELGASEDDGGPRSDPSDYSDEEYCERLYDSGGKDDIAVIIGQPPYSELPPPKGEWVQRNCLPRVGDLRASWPEPEDHPYGD